LANRFSIIVIPEGNDRVRRMSISSGAVKFALCCCLIVAGLMAFLTYSFFNYSVDQNELHELRVATSQQRQSMQGLVADLDGAYRQLDSLRETDARVRQLANFDALPQDIPVAVGGLVEVDSVATLDVVQQQINQLQIDIELRKQRQEGVRNLINDQISLSRSTPKGWPTKGWLTSYFGMRKSPFSGKMVMHEGLDIAANTGTPVIATADGVVSRVKYSPGYGKVLILDHGYGYRTIYAHNSKILVKSGQRIMRGDIVAKVGNTGRSTGSHLHYELLLNGVPIDPRKTL